MSRFLCASGCAVKLTVLFFVSDSCFNTVNQPLSLPVTQTLTQAHWGSVIFRSEVHVKKRVSVLKCEPMDSSCHVLPPYLQNGEKNQLTLRTTVCVLTHITGLMHFLKLSTTEETTNTIKTRCHFNLTAKENRDEDILRKETWLIFQINFLWCQPWFLVLFMHF